MHQVVSCRELSTDYKRLVTALYNHSQAVRDAWFRYSKESITHYYHNNRVTV